MPTRRVSWVLTSFALIWLLVSCGGGSSAPSDLDYEAFATSSTTVKVAFSRPVGTGSGVPSNYEIRYPGGDVQVHAAVPAADGVTVLLATSQLEDGRTYTLEVRGVDASSGGAISTAASSFGGTSVRAPIVASAIALSPTEILVTFATPPPGTTADMSDSALDARYYDIVEASPVFDETSDLTIESIAFAADLRGRPDRGRVILETEVQTDTAYTVRVTNVTTAAGDKLIDPTNNTAVFRGMPALDATPPSVLGATAISNTEVLVDFSEPVVGADRADRYTIEADDGTPLEVIAAAYTNPYDTQVLLTTAPQRDERTTYTVTVRGVADRQNQPIDPSANTADFLGVFRTGPIDGDTTPPRVANSGSASNTEVLVTFSEPVSTASAETPAHYRITARLDEGTLGAQATLNVLSATLSGDRTTVTLTTLAQSDLLYTLEVTNVTDLAGNQIAPPERLNDPSTLTFFGTPPSGVQADTDCDGVSDVAEQRGWFVTVYNTDGTSSRYEVSSDPGDPTLTPRCDEAGGEATNEAARDTDGDGLDDLNERIYATDPRNPDTDGDGIGDWRELNRIYSEPTHQDTDGDGLADGLEVDFFGTSPLFEDTDGDQLLDGDEAVTQNRDPLIADLPAFDMRVVGDVQLGLDVRFTAESASGSRVLETRSSESSLSTDSTRSNERSTANSTEWFINAGVKAGVEYEPPLDFKFTGEVSVDGGYKEGTTTSFTSGSVQSTQQEQASSRGTEREVEDGETVTREIVGASMAVALELASLDDIAFTIENLEVTAKLVDPRDPTSFVPIATLTSSGSQSINLGPAPDSRGPFRFTANDPAPALIEALRENPRNLLFEVANYDIVDEFGRNFTYTYQDVNDRTATLLIDYGGRRASELYRVATHSEFDDFGDPVGASLATVLETILGLEYLDEPADDELTAGCLNGSTFVLGCSPADRTRILNSYSTRSGELHRVRNVVAGTAGYDWFGEIELPLSATTPADVRDAPVTSGRTFRFLFGQDLDGDGLTVQQEAFFGSIDAPTNVLNNDCFGDPTETGCTVADAIPDSVDTDRDGLLDDEEIFGQRQDPSEPGAYDPWLVVVRGEDARTTSSSPGRFDTDGDGLTDCQELGVCTVYVYLFENDASAEPGAAQGVLKAALLADPQSGIVTGLYLDATGRPGVTEPASPSAAWELILDAAAEDLTDPSRFDSDLDGLNDAGELVGVRYLPLDAQPGDLPLQLYPGYGAGRFPNGLTNTATDPLNRDSDFDLLGDGDEVQIGIDPTNPDSTGDAALDSDGDGLRNIEERFGWVVVLRGSDGLWRDADNQQLHQAAGRLLDPSGVPIPVDVLGNPVSTVDVRLAGGVDAPARVPSDPDRADADRDGLSDGQERDLFSHPGRFDSDGDGLSDGEEANGADYPYDGVDPVRFTNPLAFDTDDDGRSDGEEVRVPWTVAVRGETPRQVFSDPLIDDEDLDLLSDVDEFDNGTDPDDADTDGDGVLDGEDIAKTLGGVQVTRNPLVPDQVVEIRYSNATVLDSCYQIGGEGSLEGWGVVTNGWYADLRYSDFGGNPDGYLWARAGNFLFGGATNFMILVAPSDFTGDKSAYYGGSFSFDLREFQRDGDQTRFDPNVHLVGNGLTLVYDNDEHTATSWTTVSVPLTASGDVAVDGWAKSGGGAVSQTELQDVLANLASVTIQGSYEAPERFFDFLFGGVGFDNPTMSHAVPPDVTNTFDDGALQAGNFRGKLNLELPRTDGSLEVLDGIVNLTADLANVSPGATRALTGAPEVFVLGRDTSFRAFSTTILEEGEDYTLGLNPDAVADYGNFSQRYTYPVIGGADSIILRGELPETESGTCELALSWTWRTLE